MAMLRILLPLLHGALTVRAQICTTVQPVFEPLPNATKLVYASTVTHTSTVTCDGCKLEVSTFPAVTGSFSQNTTTIIPITTSASFVCSPTGNSTITIPTPTSISASSLTASPIPTVAPEVQSFINELSTALLYVELLANGGNSEKLCSVINPAGLDGITGVAINGSAVQGEVCALGDIQAFAPTLATAVVEENQIGVQYVQQALFAVQVAGMYAGGTDLQTLCDEIQETLLNNLFINYIEGVGTQVRNFVCGAAAATAAARLSKK